MSIRQDVFFLTYDGRVTTQPVSEGLFVSNGTAAGTSEAIALQAPYPGSLGPAAALTYTSVFGIGGTLYATDPTTGSPLPIASFPAPSEVLSPLSLGAVAVFVATMPSGGAGLARTDGTAAGTFFITPSGAAANFNPVILGRVGNLAILEGLRSNGTAGIWATDGTNANTVLIGTAPSGTLQALGVSNGQLVVAGITSGAIPTLTSLTYIYGVTGQTQSQAVTGIAVNSGLTLPDGLLLLGGSSGLFATSGPGTAITKISSLVDPTIDYVSTVGDANSFVNAGGVAFFTVTTTGPFGVS
jgi:hypothetical protein